jgi:hypothetical protein
MKRYFEVLIDLGLGPFWGNFLATNPSREAPYHNLLHTQQMVEDSHAGALAEGIVDLPTLRALALAAIFHDWGHLGGLSGAVGRFEPATLPDRRNIDVALSHLRAVWATGCRDGTWPDDVPPSLVESLIEATEIPYGAPPAGLAHAVLRDADWMAGFRDTLVPHVIAGLAAEQGVPMRTFLASRLAALEGFQPTTPWARRVFRSRLPLARREVAAVLQMVETAAP